MGIGVAGYPTFRQTQLKKAGWIRGPWISGNSKEIPRSQDKRLL